MAKAKEDSGPVYGVRLIAEMSAGTMKQAMPSRNDLERVRKISERTAAGYEVLLMHYGDRTREVERLKDIIRQVIAGEWSPTGLQEAIGDI